MDAPVVETALLLGGLESKSRRNNGPKRAARWLIRLSFKSMNTRGLCLLEMNGASNIAAWWNYANGFFIFFRPTARIRSIMRKI